MSEYWSNEDDKKVSYVTEQSARKPRVSGGKRGSDSAPADDDAFSYSKSLEPRDAAVRYSEPYASKPQYGTDRSSFISGEANEKRQESRFEYPVKQRATEPSGGAPYGGGYQIHSEQPPDQGGGRGRGWIKFLAIFLVLALIGGAVYLFRYDILTLIGSVVGEDAVARLMPTPTPTETVPDVPAYVPAASLAMKSQAVKEIDAVAGGLDMSAYAVTEQNIVMSHENQNATFDYYLFAYDTGRLLGYYDGLYSFIPCGKNVFYVDMIPYLVSSRGFPLADLEALAYSAGSEVTIQPMVNGWAMAVSDDGTMRNFIGEDGKLISTLWYSKAFPFTADTTLAYVDTGNITGTDNRYALYLLHRDGETERLYYVPDTDGILINVCGMAFTPDGGMLMQDEALTPVMTTDDAAAYVNCGALAVRDPETGLYGLFVDGVQQYPFTFDSIQPVPSDLVWETGQTGYVTRYTVTGTAYPLPRSYSFILRKGDTEQVVSIAAASAYPIILD